MPKFVVPAGVRCHVRRVGSAEWRPHVTKREAGFESHGVADNGGRWTFKKDGWELKLASSLVIGREPKSPKAQQQKGILGRRGKGANRRRNMRAVKRR